VHCALLVRSAQAILLAYHVGATHILTKEVLHAEAARTTIMAQHVHHFALSRHVQKTDAVQKMVPAPVMKTLEARTAQLHSALQPSVRLDYASRNAYCLQMEPSRAAALRNMDVALGSLETIALSPT